MTTSLVVLAASAERGVAVADATVGTVTGADRRRGT